jgi:hypothetical protein
MPNTRQFPSAAKFSPEHGWRYHPQINVIAASHAGSKSEAFTRSRFFIDKQAASPAAIVCR